MNLTDLQAVQNTERQKDSLQHLRESFYEDVAAYIESLEAERDAAAEAADDPFASPEVRQLTDEIETAKEVVEAIYDRRLGKLVKRASLAAAGMSSVNDEGLTAEERELFADLVENIESNKSHVLDVVEGESTSPASTTDRTARARDRPVDSSATPDGAAGSPVGASSTGSGMAAAADEQPATAAEQPPLEDEQPPGEDDQPGPSDEQSVSTAERPVQGGDDGADQDRRITEEAAAVTGQPEPTAEASAAAAMGVTEGTAEGPADENSDSNSAELSGGPDGDRRADGGGSVASGTEDRTRVRITRDIGEIFGVDDRSYDLSSEDIVDLPSDNAKPLVERGAAEKVD